MNDRRSTVDRRGGLEGADAAALGTDAAPPGAPPGAAVDDEERLVPGANFDDEARRDQSKPWFTSLAAESEQAGVANDPADAQEPEFPTDPEDPR